MLFVVVKITNKTRNIIKRDKKTMIKTTRGSTLFVPEHGDGDFVYDVENNKFIDFSSFISVYNLGVNGNKEIKSAIVNQLGKLTHGAFNDFYSEVPLEFAENLLTMFPKGFGRVYLSNSGTEAIEAAIKFSKSYNDRPYIFSFYGAFHGRTIGSLSATTSKSVHRAHLGSVLGPAIHAPYAYCYRCPLKLEYPSCAMACVDYIKKYPLTKEVNPKEISALFIEPIQGEGGYVVPPKEFVKEMRELADEHGMLLVSDEIQAGYMRTGKFLSMENFGVEADIYTIAKSSGGGLPLGITVTRSSLGDVQEGLFSGTMGGNLVVAAAANASLNYIKKHESELKSGIARKGKYMMKRLNDMKEKYEIVGDVRGLGMMIGVEFVKDKKSKEPAPQERNDIIDNAFYNNLILLPCGVSTIRVIPPLTMADKNIEEGMDILESAIKKINAERKR